jgi:hypothetical protein
VSPDRISLRAQAFVADHIHSVTQLELLLLLHRDPRVEWTAARAAAEMRFPPAWARDQLERFAQSGLVAARDEDEPSFRYRPGGDHAVVVDELAELYSRRRTSLTTLIFSPARDEVQLLSDAFRIRRRKEED